MRSRYLRTSDIAKAVGVHPNTVRLYEERGFLPHIPRSASGYRLFTAAHLGQMRLAWTVLHTPWPGPEIRRSGLKLVRQAAAGDLGGALEQAHHHLALVQAERAQAETAAKFLDRWADGVAADTLPQPLWIGEAADLLGVTRDMLRNWERNGLIEVPRDPRNGYRLYGATEVSRLRVIRTLSRAGYSLMAILRMLLRFDKGQRRDLRQVLDTPNPEEDVLYVTDQWLSTLGKIEQCAADAITQLEEMIRKQRT